LGNHLFRQIQIKEGNVIVIMLDMDISSECTVLVNSCDKYEEAWSPFFILFHKYWPDCPFRIGLNTESKEFNTLNLTIEIYHSREVAWGKRLSEVLQQITSPYVIILLEDFFIRQKVKTKKIIECLEAMKTDKSIAVFYFNRITGYSDLSDKYNDYYEMHPTKDYNRYLFNCQAAIWRKDVLETVCQKAVSPWEFEENSYMRNQNYLEQYKFFCSKYTYYDDVRDDDVFSYILVRNSGYGIWQSKWLWNNRKFFEHEGIDCRCKTLPTYPKWKYDLKMLKDSVKRRLNIK